MRRGGLGQPTLTELASSRNPRFGCARESSDHATLHSSGRYESPLEHLGTRTQSHWKTRWSRHSLIRRNRQIASPWMKLELDESHQVGRPRLDYRKTTRQQRAQPTGQESLDSAISSFVVGFAHALTSDSIGLSSFPTETTKAEHNLKVARSKPNVIWGISWSDDCNQTFGREILQKHLEFFCSRVLRPLQKCIAKRMLA